MTVQATSQAVDVAIVGGGMVGASLAAALAPLGLKLALVEAVPHDSASQPSFDERTTALSNGSRRFARSTSRIRATSALRASMRKNRASRQWAMWCPIARWGRHCGRAFRQA